MSLNDQLRNFKKSQSANADIAVKRAGQITQNNDLKRSYGTISNNTKAAFEGAKKKKKSTGKVYIGHHKRDCFVYITVSLFTTCQYWYWSTCYESTLYCYPILKSSYYINMSFLYIYIYVYICLTDHYVYMYIQDSDSPQSVVSIASRTKVDITKNAALWEKLIHNDKIEYDSVNNTFAYKPTYQIKSKEDLLSLLIAKRKEGGMDYKDLKDSYSKLSSAVEELAGEGVILVVRNKDGNPRVLFYNDAQYNTPIDPG